MSEWSACLHDLGTHIVKQGVRLQLYNVGEPASADAGTKEKQEELRRRLKLLSEEDLEKLIEITEKMEAGTDGVGSSGAHRDGS